MFSIKNYKQSNDDDLLAATSENTVAVYKNFMGALYLSLLQLMLMVCAVIFFFEYIGAAVALSGAVGCLIDYIPILIKYRAIQAQSKFPFDFAVVSSIYIFFLGVDLLAVIFFVRLSIKSLPHRLRFRFSSINVVMCLLALCFVLIPVFDLCLGPTNLKYPGISSNGIFYGNVFTAFIKYCFVFPILNMSAFFLVQTAVRNR